MKTRTNTHMRRRLGPAILVCALVAASPGVMAQVAAPQQAPEQAPQQTQPQTPQVQTAQVQSQDSLQDPATKQEPAARSMVTGSNIARVRKEPAGLPLVVLDRSYIDQSGASTSRELLQTVPQLQNR